MKPMRYTGLQWSDSNRHQCVVLLRNAPKHQYSLSLDPTPNLWLDRSNKHTQGLTLAKVRTGMKEMTKIRRVGGKGIKVRPTWTSDMQSRKMWAIMPHAVKQSTKYIIHVHIQAMTIKMNSDTDSILKDDQDNIQASESTHQVRWYIVVSLCMWSDQNNHDKNQSHYAKQGNKINQYNQHVNVSNEYSNEEQKHRYIRILNQDNQSTQSAC